MHINEGWKQDFLWLQNLLWGALQELCKPDLENTIRKLESQRIKFKLIVVYNSGLQRRLFIPVGTFQEHTGIGILFKINGLL